jgi:tape measure domain-containing protein
VSVDVAQLLVRLGLDAREVDQGLPRVSRQFQDFTRQTTAAGKASGGLFDLIGGGARAASLPLQLLGGAFNLVTAPVRLLTGALGSMAGQFAIGTLAARGFESAMHVVADATIGFNSRLEQSKMAWTTFLGSALDAEAWQYRMQKFAALTPFDYEGLEEGYTLLRAYGFAIQELEPWMRRLGNASAAVGQGTQGIRQLALAVGQVRTMGVLQGQEARQLFNMGVPVWQLLADRLGKSEGQVKAMSEAGEISAEIFEEAFVSWIESKGDLMGALNRTLKGSWSTITDTVQMGAASSFRPFFDLLSEGSQSLAKWLQTDDFERWAARMNAASEVVVAGLRELGPVVAEMAGEVLGLLWDLASSAAEALSYLNPFAEHSPSLVDQVDAGTREILERYGELREIATPFKAGSDELKRYMVDQRYSVDALGGALDKARDSLQQWQRTPLRGETAHDDRLFNMQQQIKRAQLEVSNLYLQHAPERQVREAERRVQELQRQYERVRLQGELRFDPQRRRIEKAAEDRPAEQSLSTILAGIRDAKRDIADLTPIYEAQKTVLDGMTQAAREAGKALADGVGATRKPDDKSFLGVDKEAIERIKETAKQMRSDFEQVKTFMDGLVSGASRFVEIVRDARQYGLAGGLSQLLYPTAYGYTEGEQQANDLIRRANALERQAATDEDREPKLLPLLKPSFLEPPKFTDWEPLLDQMWIDFEKAASATWTKIEPDVVKLGEKIGDAVVRGMSSAVGRSAFRWLTGGTSSSPEEWVDRWFGKGQKGDWLYDPEHGVAATVRRAGSGEVAPQEATADFWRWVREEETKRALESYSDVGKAAVKGFVDALGDDSTTSRAVSDWADDAICTPLQDTLEVRSPSRLTARYGEYLAEGLTVGLRRSQVLTYYQVKTWLGDTVGQALTDYGTVATKGGETLGQQIGKGIQAGMQGTKLSVPSIPSGGGNTSDPGEFPGRALGGWAYSGRSYVVGEERTEVFTPGTSGYVHPSVGSGSPTFTGPLGLFEHLGVRDVAHAREVGQSLGRGVVEAWRQVTGQGVQFPLGLARGV